MLLHSVLIQLYYQYKKQGKIEKTDWNVKEIEKKIEENKMGRGVRSHDKMERVPKWSREQVNI